MRDILPAELTDILNSGMDSKQHVLFEGRVQTEPLNGDVSIDLSYPHLKLTQVERTAQGRRYGIAMNDISNNPVVTFFLNRECMAKLTHPSEGANRIEIPLDSGRTLYLSNFRHILY